MLGVLVCRGSERCVCVCFENLELEIVFLGQSYRDLHFPQALQATIGTTMPGQAEPKVF